MQEQRSQKLASQKPVKNRAKEKVQKIANEHCLMNYGTSYAGGEPYLLALPMADFWFIPIVLTSPGFGKVGEVGMLAVDAGIKSVVAATPSDEVRAAGNQMAQENHHELEAAFRRARKA